MPTRERDFALKKTASFSSMRQRGGSAAKIRFSLRGGTPRNEKLSSCVKKRGTYEMGIDRGGG